MTPHTSVKPTSSDNLQESEKANLAIEQILQISEKCPTQNEMVAPEFITRLKCSSFKNEFRWQNFKKSPKGRLSYLLDNGTMSDITLKFSDGVVVKSHKLMLSMLSPVYATSFLGLFEKSTEIVEVTTSTTFAWVAAFMYKGIFTISNLDMAISLYEFAHEKHMEIIIKISRTYMLSHMNLENVFGLLEKGTLYMDKSLSDECVKMIFGKRESIFMTEETNYLTMNTLRELIIEGHQRCSETTFFKKIHSWAIVNVVEADGGESVSPESLRKTVWPLISLLKFENIPLEFIIKEVFPSNLISPEDGILMVRQKVGSLNAPSPKFLEGDIPDRKIRFENEHTKIIQLNLFRKPYGCNVTFLYSHYQEPFTGSILQITCSERIFLRSVKALPKCYSGSWKMFITDSSDCQVGSVSSEGPPWDFDVLIPLSPEKVYKAKITGKGRFNKHPISEYEESLAGISFSGDGIACKLRISYHVN